MLTKTKLVQSTDSGAKLRSAVVPPLREAHCHSANELCTRTDIPAPQEARSRPEQGGRNGRGEDELWKEYLTDILLKFVFCVFEISRVMEGLNAEQRVLVFNVKNFGSWEYGS